MNKLLTYVIILLASFIAVSTAAAFLLGRAHPGDSLRRSDPLPPLQADSRPAADGTGYLSLGQLRTTTRQDAGTAKNGGAASVVVLKSWVSYPADDSAFYDELAQKNRKIKSIVTDYFASHTQRELLVMGEELIKTELAAKINAELVLGNIGGIFFDEYIFFD